MTLIFANRLSTTISGEITPTTLSLSFPQTDGTIITTVFRPGTTAEYNTAIQALQASAAQLQGQAAAAAASASSVAAVQKAVEQATAAADSAVDVAARTLNYDLQSMSRDGGAVQNASSYYSADLKKQSADLEQLKADAAAAAKTLAEEGKGGFDVCTGSYKVNDDGYRVTDDGYTITDHGADSAATSLTTDLKAVDADQTAFSAAQSAAPNYAPQSVVPDTATVAAELATGQKMFDRYTSDNATATATSKANIAEANKIASTTAAAGGC